MNKLDSPIQTPTFTIDSSAQTDNPFHQLIVLIPENADYAPAVRNVWELANVSGAHIQLLSLCPDPLEEASLRRRLVTLASLLQQGNVTVEWNVEFGSSWLKAVKRNSCPNDLVVCFAEQRAGFWQRPLSQILQSSLSNPVYILSGHSPQKLPQSNRLSQLMAWAGSIGIIILSFLLQIRLTSLPQDWIQTTLLILSVIGEAWLIWGWNSLFS